MDRKRYTTTVHIHETLFEKVYELAKKTGMTQADAIEKLFDDARFTALQATTKLEECQKQLQELQEKNTKLEKEIKRYKEMEKESLQKLKRK